MFDYLVVGAGFAGAVMAERMASDAGRKVLLVDKRPHVGGNALRHLRRGWYSRPHLRAAYLSHQFARCLRLPVAVHGVATLSASRASLRRRAARSDADQPRHRQRALWPNLTSFELEQFFASVAEAA